MAIFEKGFDSAFCTAILRFFWICYRRGIMDGAACGDADECMEGASRLSRVGSFGTLNRHLDWNEWQFTALLWTREDLCRLRIMDLLMSLRRPDMKLSFLLQIAQLFYAHGLSDYAECSGWLDEFKARNMPRYPYLLKHGHSFRPSTRRERFEFFQGICLDMIRIQGEATDGGYLVPAQRVRAFVERVWAAMQHPKWFDDIDIEKDDDYDDREEEKPRRRDRRVPRKDARRRDAAADGSALQQGAPKRKRGRPPKNV